jgi:hypothetical protein
MLFFHLFCHLTEFQYVHSITLTLWQSWPIEYLPYIVNLAYAAVFSQQFHWTTLFTQWIDKSRLNNATIIRHNDNRIW